LYDNSPYGNARTKFGGRRWETRTPWTDRALFLLSKANIEPEKTVEQGPLVPVIEEQIKTGKDQVSRHVGEEVEINEPGFREIFRYLPIQRGT